MEKVLVSTDSRVFFYFRSLQVYFELLTFGLRTGRLAHSRSASLLSREVWGFMTGFDPVKLDTVSPEACHRSDVFLELCCAALSSGEEPCHSLHGSAYYREYDEDLI